MSSEHTVDSVSYYFEEMRKDVLSNPLNFMFTALRAHLEARHNFRILLMTHGKVKPGKAIAGPLKDKRFYVILLNEQDVRNGLARFRVAHELAHLACHHVAEVQRCVDRMLGEGKSKASRYVIWRNMQEDEADVFAANLFYAHGSVVERHIPTEAEYAQQVGDITISEIEEGATSTPRPSVLNQPSFRKKMREDLRIGGHIKPPLPILCQTLASKLKIETINGTHRKTLAAEIHADYRRRLTVPEEKPEGTCCLDCKEGLARVCGE